MLSGHDATPSLDHNKCGKFGLVCPGTIHSTASSKLEATNERQRLRLDHQTIEIRVREPDCLV